jgi:polyphosphate kinase 2 (PPK2 family)
VTWLEKEKSYDFSLHSRHVERVALVLHSAEIWSYIDSQAIGETATMDYRKRFVVEPGARVQLGKIDPAFKDKHESHDSAAPELQKHIKRMAELQYLLYADGNQSLLVVLQALDAGGKDGAVRHVFSAMNPQGTWVFGFKQPSKLEAAHDFLWRAHQAKVKS